MNNPICTSLHDRYAGFRNAAAQDGGGGELIKFTKDGRWETAAGGVDITGTPVTVAMPNLMVGWVKFVDRKPADRQMVLVAEERPRDRQSLGDLDEAQWPRDDRGQPQDPWVYQYAVPMVDDEGGAYLWCPSSSGGLKAIGNLCAAFARKRKLPHARLDTASYKHSKYGKIYTPSFTVVAWLDDQDATALPAPESAVNSSADDPDDDIPF